MTAVLTLILRPVIGAVIGYITNDVAIRMLFRPRTAKYIFGMRVPFTPGIIPKEKGRIAASIGNAISINLMNREVLERTLLSDEMIGKITASIDGFVDRQLANEETLRQFLTSYITDDELETLCQSATENLAAQIHTSLASAGLGQRIAHMAVSHAIDKTRSSLLGKLGADQLVSLVAGPMENLLAKNIDEMLASHSQEMVGQLIADQLQQLLSRPMSSLMAEHAAQIGQLRDLLLTVYRTVVTDRLPRILDAVNISDIVERRIMEMDERETERLILEVMNKELRAIVWLGALLGFVMGCINLLF